MKIFIRFRVKTVMKFAIYYCSFKYLIKHLLVMKSM